MELRVRLFLLRSMDSFLSRGFLFFVQGMAFVGVIWLSGCVNLSLPKTETVRALKVQLVPPPSPLFQPYPSEVADRAWRSSKTGNTLAYISECTQKSIPPSVKEFEKDILKGLGEYSIVKTTYMASNGRNGRLTLAESDLDGQSLRLYLFSLAKGNCLYNMSFLGSVENFDSEKDVFLKFQERFQIP